MRVLIFVTFTAVLLASTANALPQGTPSSTTTFPRAEMQLAKPLLDYLIPAVKQTGKPARIYLVADCPVGSDSQEDRLNGNVRFLYRNLDLDLSPTPRAGIDAVRHLLHNEPHVVINQDRAGMIRIRLDSVSTTILQTTLTQLILSKYAQYTALSALDELFRAPELTEAQQRSHIELRNHVIDHLVGWGRGPHLPSAMQHVTVDQVLDAIAKTFNGIIVYGYCEMPDHKAWFDVRFVWDGKA